MFPKHTLLQNSTLAIHVPTAMLSCEMAARVPSSGVESFKGEALGEVIAGEGTTSGLIPSNANIPASPTNVERMKPGLERSMRYQSTGLTRARVSDTWRVDCQGSLR